MNGSLNKIADKTLIKFAGKIYIFIFSKFNKVNSCEDPLSEWSLAHEFKNGLLCPKLNQIPLIYTYFEGSIYYLNGSAYINLRWKILNRKKSKTLKIQKINKFRIL
ncbi:unnamed protein product [Blepharisma stoltei]|uniref:Uncharacterized protein n=1 Tax=Blepharisma stoltei TaxID=1481888 RepID=A0AAU9IPY8_9CILI|nr:unnamed protein product [Blepharisma stoltei]